MGSSLSNATFRNTSATCYSDERWCLRQGSMSVKIWMSVHSLTAGYPKRSPLMAMFASDTATPSRHVGEHADDRLRSGSLHAAD